MSEYNEFAVCAYSAPTSRNDYNILRDWFVRWNGADPVMSRDFERAKKMSISEAVDVYRKIDGLSKKIGIVPLD